jgi:hypothetical protein
MPTQEQLSWTEKQAVALEAMQREVQRVKQEHEAALEEQKEALLRCQHEIQSLRELTIELATVRRKAFRTREHLSERSFES